MATHRDVGRKPKTVTFSAPTDTTKDIGKESGIDDTSNPADRWRPRTDEAANDIMPMNQISSPEPVLALRVRDGEGEHTFFVHRFLLLTSEYFKDIFAHQPGLTEHTLPLGTEVKTVGNYVSFLYAHMSSDPSSLPKNDLNTFLSQLISTARIYRLTCNECLNHSWVMNRAYNTAKNILQNAELSWRNEDTALQTVRKAQSAFIEWSDGYDRRDNAWKIARDIAGKFAQTCPEAVFNTYAEGLGPRFINTVSQQLVRIKQQQETELAHSRASSRATAGPSAAGSSASRPLSPRSLTAGQNPGLASPLNVPVMQGAPPTIPASLQRLVSPTIAQGISPVTPPGSRQATNAKIAPPTQQTNKHTSLPGVYAPIQTRTQTPSPIHVALPQWPQPAVVHQTPQQPQPAVVHQTPQQPQPAVLPQAPQRFATNVPSRYRQRGHNRSVSENISTANRRNENALPQAQT